MTYLLISVFIVPLNYNCYGQRKALNLEQNMINDLLFSMLTIKSNLRDEYFWVHILSSVGQYNSYQNGIYIYYLGAVKIVKYDFYR